MRSPLLFKCTAQATPRVHSHAPSPASLLRQRRRALALQTPLGAGGGLKSGRARSGGVGGGQLARVGDNHLLRRRAAGRADLPARRRLSARPEVQADARYGRHT